MAASVQTVEAVQRREPPAGRLRLPRSVWLAIAVGCTVAGGLDALQTGLRTRISSDSGTVEWAWVFFQWSEWVLLAAMTPIAVVLARRFPVRGRYFIRNLAIHGGGAALLCLGWATGGTVLRRQIGLGWEDHSLWMEWGTWLLFSTPWSFFIYFALLGSIHAFSFHLEGRDRELEAARLEGQLAEARLSALRAQLQPHFLFNTLNALTVLVRDQQTAPAVGMLDRLSELLRQLLRSDQPHEVPLSTELHLVEQYLAIEQIRFSDRLHVDYATAPEALAALVPSPVLQPLVENALRHGLAEDGDVWIEVGAAVADDRLHVWVRDHGPGLRGETELGVGLRNTRARLQSLYGDAASLTLTNAPDGGAQAVIVVPYRTSASSTGEGAS